MTPRYSESKKQYELFLANNTTEKAKPKNQKKQHHFLICSIPFDKSAAASIEKKGKGRDRGKPRKAPRP